MDFYQTLQSFKQRVDREITKHFDVAIKKTRKRDVLSAEALEYVKKLTLAGGKRLRPALLYWGYLAAGGKDEKKILQAAVGIEFIHMFLLVHDDIIDCGKTRHGVNSFNQEFALRAKKLFVAKDFQRFGDSAAIIVGDMLFALGNTLLASAGFGAEAVLEVLTKLQGVIFNTAVGQMQDVHIEYKKEFGEKEVLQMYANKTAQYTFEGPLLLGAVLAGNQSQTFLRNLSNYALPLGVAFQIQDDILGVFGNAKKMGKSTVSDIAEGKRTLLVVKALEKATRVQQKQLQQSLGNKKIKAQEIEKFKQILRDTGSLSYAQKMVQKNIAKSKRSLAKMQLENGAAQFLFGMADYMEKREI